MRHLNKYQFQYKNDTSMPGWEHEMQALHDNNPVGQITWGDGGVISDLYVLPTHRGQRLSDTLLEQAYIHALGSGGKIPTPNHASADDLSPDGAKFAKRTWWAGQDDPDTGTISYDIKTN